MKRKDSRQPPESAPHIQLLERYERLLGIDLSASKKLGEHWFVQTRDIAMMLFDKLVADEVLDPKEISTLRKVVSHPVVLTPEDHQRFAVAALRKRIANIEQMVAGMPPSEIATSGVAPLLEHMRQDLDYKTAFPVPPANGINVLDPKRNGVIKVLTFSAGDYPMSQAGAIAEEVVHAVGNMMPALTALGLEPAQVIALEEIAVKYYVVTVLREFGFVEDVAQFLNWHEQIPASVSVWEAFRQELGEKQTDDMYFKGRVRLEHILLLMRHIHRALAEGKLI